MVMSGPPEAVLGAIAIAPYGTAYRAGGQQRPSALRGFCEPQFCERFPVRVRLGRRRDAMRRHHLGSNDRVSRPGITRDDRAT